MEIVKRVVVSVNNKSEETNAIIDTGAERTMISEDILLKIGAPQWGSSVLVTVGELKEKKTLYGVMVKMDDCEFGLTVIGGKKTLIGHDFLQLARAIINEVDGTVKLTKNWIDM